MTRLQFGRGHAMRCDVFLQMRRQLHGQRTYFLPAGAFLMGVASVQLGHLTTCWSRFPEMSMAAWHTRHVTMGEPPLTELYVGGANSSIGLTRMLPSSKKVKEKLKFPAVRRFLQNFCCCMREKLKIPFSE
jgi:hypothetical protein